jgi:GTP-sensing pleiotropic transcriptional regulator CodY
MNEEDLLKSGFTKQFADEYVKYFTAISEGVSECNLKIQKDIEKKYKSEDERRFKNKFDFKAVIKN